VVIIINTVILLGRICNDLESKYTAQGKLYIKFKLAVARRGKDAGTDFVSCVAWDKTAEFMQNHFAKGSQLALEGRIQTGQYDDKYGKRVYTTDVIVEQTYFTGKSTQQNENQESTMSQPFSPVTDDMGELPF
jgi:single-strand DNA-binding protein